MSLKRPKRFSFSYKLALIRFGKPTRNNNRSLKKDPKNSIAQIESAIKVKRKGVNHSQARLGLIITERNSIHLMTNVKYQVVGVSHLQMINN